MASEFAECPLSGMERWTDIDPRCRFSAGPRGSNARPVCRQHAIRLPGNKPATDGPARMANAKEIAQAALFLLSDRSSFMTGSPMVVDGGMSVACFD